jgi:copper(I)-binding protein
MKSAVVALALLVCTVTAAAAQSADTSIEVASPWARATVGALKDGVVYLTIINKGSTDDRLMAVSTPAAKTTELHKSVTENGVTKMVQLQSITAGHDGKTVLQPGGDMIMLLGLAAPLKVGQAFPMALTFEKAGRVAVVVKVEKAGASAPADMKGMNMD